MSIVDRLSRCWRACVYGLIATLCGGLVVAAWAQGMSIPPTKNTQICEGSPPLVCQEKSAADLRYERILDALYAMEGGKLESSKTPTPANEPASYGPVQMLIVNILDGLQKVLKRGEALTFESAGGRYQITRDDIVAADGRGYAFYAEVDDLGSVLGVAKQSNDYRSLDVPPISEDLSQHLDRAGIEVRAPLIVDSKSQSRSPPPTERCGGATEAIGRAWLWERAVMYEKFVKLAGELRIEYAEASVVVKDGQGTAMRKIDARGRVDMKTFETWARSKGDIPGVEPKVNYWDRFSELTTRAYKCDPKMLNRVERYLRKTNPVAPGGSKAEFKPSWNEGYHSFFNRAALQHPRFPYQVFKDGVLQWYAARHREIDREFIDAEIGKVVPRGKRSQLHSDGVEREWAGQVAGNHNGSGRHGSYAEKFLKMWDDIGWKFKCGKDPREGKA